MPSPMPPSPEDFQGRKESNNSFIPNLGVRELTATWEMLVSFKKAIKDNAHWRGEDVQAVAMGLQMIMTMEGQYRAQLEMAKQREKENVQAIKDNIVQGGRTVHAKSGAPTEVVH